MKEVKFKSRILLFIVLFIYIYDIKISIFPYYLNYILSCLGTLSFIRDLTSYKFLLQKKLVSRLVITLFMIFFFYLITYIFNSNGDFYYIKEIVALDLLLIMGAYYVYKLFVYYYKVVDIHIVLKYYLLCILTQLFLSLIMFFNQSVYLILDSFLLRSELESAVVEGTRENRLIGFGVAFFTSGIINSIALVFIALYLTLKDRLISNRFLFISFLLISLIGLMMSRTTLIGIILAICITLYKKKNVFTSRTLFYSICCSAFLFVFMVVFDGEFFNMNEKFSVVFDFGFELFENLFVKGEVSTSSTNKMFEMYNILPSNLKTWVLGDGFYRNPVHPELGYYMETDIGFFRLIFNGGIIGVIMFMLLQFTVIKNLSRSFGYISVFVLCAMIIILNLKGVVDYLKFVCLFAFIENFKNIKNEEYTVKV
ncbi:O-antigen ligase family protein [Myroides marinus]|uniref:O-antigen ligase family protein n=1 Tax=Myroides marinus TaxID=703342 RepID=UPI0025774B15|nr:O-antigen ligase family protein [Myroides marinus]MDM1348437.1 oligosaccharide repeat unit polymerase [Myroides marinus]